MSTTITALEGKVLEGINNSDFGDNVGDSIWAGTENCDASTKQTRGALTSLQEKGLVSINDDMYRITKAGLQVCLDNELYGKFDKEEFEHALK